MEGNHERNDIFNSDEERDEYFRKASIDNLPKQRKEVIEIFKNASGIDQVIEVIEFGDEDEAETPNVITCVRSEFDEPGEYFRIKLYFEDDNFGLAVYEKVIKEIEKTDLQPYYDVFYFSDNKFLLFEPDIERFDI